MEEGAALQAVLPRMPGKGGGVSMYIHQYSKLCTLLAQILSIKLKNLGEEVWIQDYSTASLLISKHVPSAFIVKFVTVIISRKLWD